MTHLGSVDIEDSSEDDLDHHMIIEMEALEEVEDHNHMHAAHTAAASGQKEILRYLIAEGVDINILDGSNGNVLHYALSDSDTDMCKLAVDLGANIATPINFTGHPLNGSYMMSAVEWAVDHCLGKIDVISLCLSHIAERGDSFWKVDEVSGKSMIMNTVSGCPYNSELWDPSCNKWISQFLQGAIRTCDSSDVEKLEEDLEVFFAKNATSCDGGTDVLEVILDATGSLRAAFYGDSQKPDMKKVILPGTPLWDCLGLDEDQDEEQGEGETVPGKEFGTLMIQALSEFISTYRSSSEYAWGQKILAAMRAKIDWLLDHGATPPKP